MSELTVGDLVEYRNAFDGRVITYEAIITTIYPINYWLHVSSKRYKIVVNNDSRRITLDKDWSVQSRSSISSHAGGWEEYRDLVREEDLTLIRECSVEELLTHPTLAIRKLSLTNHDSSLYIPLYIR